MNYIKAGLFSWCFSKVLWLKSSSCTLNSVLQEHSWFSSVRHGVDLKSFDKCMQYIAGNKTQSNTDLH